MDKRLTELVQKLRDAAGANLKSVILYGSAVTGEFQKDYSDVNLLCVFERLDAATLAKLNPAAVWWGRQGQRPPMLFACDELARAADVFAVELYDIKQNHRVLHGEDVIASLPVPMNHHRLQVERELRTHVVRLREGYLAMPQDRKRVLELMTASISSFATLFRHALIAMGEPAPAGKHEAVDRLAAQLGFDAAAFHEVLEVREGKRKDSQVDVSATFAAYLDGVSKVADEVDRRLT